MSDTSNDISTAPAGSRRRNILLAILAVLTVGLVYDFAVARPAVEQAYTIVTEKNAEFNTARKHQAMGVADVRELLAREPSRTFEDRELHVEVYSWRSGLPFRTHDLFVVYRTVLGEKFVTRLSKFGHDSEDEFQAVSEYQVSDRDGEAPDTAPAGDAPEPYDAAEQGDAAEEDEAEEDDAEESASDKPEGDESPDATSPTDLPETDKPEQDDED